MPDWNEIKPLLNAKLDSAHVRPPAKFGPKGDYLEGWLVIAEANRIFGFGGWSYHIADCHVVSDRPREIGREKKPGFGVSYVATVTVQVGDVSRSDVGAGHGYDVDCGLAHESAVKEAVTDALKRALRTFGNPFGLALYDKSRENVEDTTSAPQKAAPKLSERAAAPAPRQDGQANVDPALDAIAWLKTSRSADEVKARWAKIQETHPELAAREGVQKAFSHTFDKFAPFPGDQESAA
jgi:DNA recombination protein Rad52